MANSVDPDLMQCSATSDLGLHCLQKPTCPNTKGFYGKYCKIHYCIYTIKIFRKLNFLHIVLKFDSLKTTG